MYIDSKKSKVENRNRKKNMKRYILPPYRVTFNRVNDSVFTGVKYAEIYPNWDWVHGEPVKVLYAFTWTGLNKRVNRWLIKHQLDITV